MRMRISFLPKRPLKRFAKIFPMLQTGGANTGQRNLQEQGVLGSFSVLPRVRQAGAAQRPLTQSQAEAAPPISEADEILVPIQKNTVLPTYLLSL